jgi:two-component system NtrC family sensor kinase
VLGWEFPQAKDLGLSRSDESEQLFKVEDLVDCAPVSMLLVGNDGVIRRANAEAARLFGWPLDELVGAPVEMLVPGPLRQSHVEQRRKWAGNPHVRAMGGSSRLQARHADGSLFPVDVMLSPIGGAGALAVVVDRTALGTAEERLRRRDAAFARVLESVPDIVYVVRAGASPVAGHVELVSEHVNEVIGHDANEFIEDPSLWIRSIHPDDASELERTTRELFTEKVPIVRSYRMRHRDSGEWRVMEDRVAPIIDENGRVTGYCGAARDVTQQRKTQANLVMTERLATLGMLAASVAHELSNPLTYVLGTVDKASKLAEDGDTAELTRVLAEARDGAERMRQILRDLTGLSRADHQPRPIDPRRSAEIALRLAGAHLSERAAVVRRFDDIPNVVADETRLSQVLLNLLMNATQAVPGDRRGEIVVVTRRDEQGRAVVEVVDDGCGMASDVLARAFDPFVTTKAPGLGTGLGLYVSRSIIQEIGGTLTLDSEIGRGTTARVVLPPAR